MTMKKGLEVRNVPKHSKYSGISQVKYDFSRLDVRFLQGKSLLASDVLTGKSDPVCFVWIGPGSEEITKDDLACEDKGILHTKVCPTTVDPIWNEDIIFELPTLDINELSYFKLVIFVRDEDIMEDESISYDELGIIIVPFRDIILNGKAMKDSIVLSARWYTLVKTPGMRKVDGSVKLTVSLIFHKKDSAIIMDQVDEKYKEADTSSCHGIGLTAQHAMAGLLGNPLPMRTPSPSPLRGSSDNLLTSRLTTARSRSSSRASSPSSVLRRPATAPSIRRSISNLDTVEENGSVMGFEQENSQDENGTYRGGSQGGNSRSDLSLDFSKLSGDKRKGALKEGNKNKIATKQSSTTEEQNNANTSQNGSEIDENESNQFNNNTDQQDEQEYDENDAVIGEEIENSNEVEVNNQDASEAVAVDDSRATLQRQNHLRPNRPNGVSSKIVEPQSTTGSNPESLHEVSQKGFVGSSNGSDQAASRKDANNAIQPRESANVPEVTGKGKEEIADDQQKDERLSQNQDVLDELLSKGSILAKALQGDEALPEQPPSRLEASTSKIPSRKDQISVSKSSDAPHSENLKSELLEEDARKNNGSNGMEKEQSVQSSRSMNSKGKNDNSSMQGSTTAVVRALKEMSAHRETLEKSIRELVSVTKNGLDKLNQKFQSLEGTVTGINKTKSNSDNSLQRNDSSRFARRSRQSVDDFDRYHDDEVDGEFVLSDDEYVDDELIVIESNAKKGSNPSISVVKGQAGRNRKQSGGRSDGSNQENLSSGVGGKHGNSRSKRNSIGKDSSTVESRKTNESSRKNSNTRPKSAGSVKKANGTASKSGNTSGKYLENEESKYNDEEEDYPKRSQSAKARPDFKAFKAAKKKDMLDSGMSSEPDTQFIYKGEGGKIMTTTTKPNYQPPVGEPLSMDATYINTHNSNAWKTRDANDVNGNIDVQRSPPRSNAMTVPSYGNRQTDFSSSYRSDSGNFSPPRGDTNSTSLLNKDFCEVMDTGTMEDVAYLLEACGPKPEMLSMSTRNRLYDIVSTLLQQNSHVERCLLWILALTRGGVSGNFQESSSPYSMKVNLLGELAGHTRKDLIEALEFVSKEPSKRGLLASLLKSQINKQAMPLSRTI